MVAAYNETPHQTVHGEPSGVRARHAQAFLITQDSAAKLKGNQALLESRKELADKGAFRRPLRAAGGAFRRGFRATYGDVEKVQEVRGSIVTPQGGGEKIDIKRIQSVDRETGDLQPWLGGLSMRDSRKKDKLIPLMTALITHLEDGEERSVASAALWLKRHMGSAYEDALREVGFGKHLAEAIRLFDQHFQLTKGGYYVKLA